MLISQPSDALLLQLEKPPLQAIWQVFVTQDGVPLVPLHLLPQPLQWLTSFVTLISQPSAALLLQLANPVLQAIWQAPPTHAG